jgi:hypothetical protein
MPKGRRPRDRRRGCEVAAVQAIARSSIKKSVQDLIDFSFGGGGRASALLQRAAIDKMTV